MTYCRRINMAELSDEHYLFGFATFFDFEKGKSKSVDPQDIPKTNNGEDNLAYLSPTRLDFIEDVTELCVTWSTIFQLLKATGKVTVCGWGEGRIISPDENIFLPLDEKMVTLRSSWNKLLMISETGRCHVTCNSHDDWTMHSVTCGAAANEEGAKENTFALCDVGDMHSIVVDKKGQPYQIDEDRTITPIKYLSLAIPFEIRVDEVKCGKEYVLLLNEKHGTVYSFGLGTRGQLGHGEVDSQKNPRRIEALTGIRIKQIAAGGWHSLALSEFGDVYSWGWNERGQLGITCVPPEVPSAFYALPYIVEFPGDSVVVCVGCGARHSVAVTSGPAGDVWSWGWGHYGQLGHGDTEDRETPTVVEYFRNIDSTVMGIACGRWQTVVHTRKKNQVDL